MKGARSGPERLFVDGETWRQALALRRGFGDGWEALLELSVVSHVPGVFDGFIETWHDFFHLPQGGRDTAPRDRLAIRYDKGSAGVHVTDGVTSLGDIALGVGHAVKRNFLANHGLAIRGAVRLPTGEEDALAGAGGVVGRNLGRDLGAAVRRRRLALRRGARRPRREHAGRDGDRRACRLRPVRRDLAGARPPRLDGPRST